MFLKKLAYIALGALFLSAGTMSSRAETLPAVVRIGLPGTVGTDMRAGRRSALNKSMVDEIEKAFEGTGTKIEVSYFVNAGPGINEAFAADQIDFTVYGDFPAVIARSGGIDIKLLAPANRGASESYLVVPTDSTATSIEDLKGKRLSVNMGRPWVLALTRLTESKGLKFTDFQLYNLVMPDGDAAVSAHSVDATYTLDGLQLKAANAGKIIWSTRDAPLDWKFSADLFGAKRFIDKYPDAVTRVVEGTLRAAHKNSLPENRDSYIRDYAEGQLIPYELAVESWNGKDVKAALSPLFDPFVAAHYADVTAFAIQNKLIRKSFAVGDLLEPKFANAALAKLSLTDFWTPVDAQGKPVAKSVTATAP
jgi:sulfonate transport system substrate-binding protein